MGRERTSLEFWDGFEKQANMFLRMMGKGKAVDRLNKIRTVSPNFGKPPGFGEQFMKSPSTALSNVAAKASATHHSPSKKILRGAGALGIGAAGTGYMAIREKEGDTWYGQQP